MNSQANQQRTQVIDLRDRTLVPEYGTWSGGHPDGTRNISIFTHAFLRKGDLLVKPMDGDSSKLTLWVFASVPDICMGQGRKGDASLWKGVIKDVIYNKLLTAEMQDLLAEQGLS
mgnify:CR=1 FL=1